jgi:TatD DNase family protein
VPAASEIRQMNSDCDALERRLAALEAKRAAAAAAATTSADPLLNLADVAANITHEDLRPDLEHHVSTAQSAGVRYLVTPSMTVDGPRGAQQTLNLARAHPGTILPCAGVHPFWAAAVVGDETRVDGAECAPAAVEALREVAANPEVRCVGECGLDFSKGPTEVGGYPAPAAQLRWFEQQVSLAVELAKPLYLHERDAHAEFLGVLRPLYSASMLPPCVIHAFTGSEEELSAYRAMDFYIGVTGHFLRKKNPMVEWLPHHVPLSRLLIETDSPYMGFKGCRKTEPTENNQKHTYPNVPASLPGLLQAVAKSYGVTDVEVAKATTENAKRFFSI